MITSRIFLSGIRAAGHHGARPGEKDEPQDFVIDLDIEVEVADDVIDATADYRGVSEGVREIVEKRSFDLIEIMADAIARWVAEMPNVTRVTAMVHKPGAAKRLNIDGVAAAATVSSRE